MTDAMPSAASAVRERRACSPASMRVAWRTRSARPARSVRLIDRTASGAASAISAASASAVVRTSSRATQTSASPSSVGLVALEPPPRQQHERRLRRTEELRQRDRQPEALVDPEAGEVGAEASLGARDAQVGRERQAQTAADGGSVDGRHPRQVDGAEPGGGGVQPLGGEPTETVATAAVVAAAAEVGAGAERLPLRREHAAPDVEVAGALVEGVGDGLDHLQREVVVGRSLQLHEQHVPVAFGPDHDGAPLAVDTHE